MVDGAYWPGCYWYRHYWAKRYWDHHEALVPVGAVRDWVGVTVVDATRRGGD
jgi:hypothetical protein